MKTKGTFKRARRTALKLRQMAYRRNPPDQLTAGLPNTRDGFGNGGVIVFAGMVGGPPMMKFQSDGRFIDGNGNPINRTVFVGIPNMPSAARAVTFLGATGRVRSYRYTGTTWIR